MWRTERERRMNVKVSKREKVAAPPSHTSLHTLQKNIGERESNNNMLMNTNVKKHYIFTLRLSVLYIFVYHFHKILLQYETLSLYQITASIYITQ